jgi:hypothetical protein
MKFSLGTVLPSGADDNPAQLPGYPPAEPGAAPSAPAWTPPTAPAGYWVNPADPSQWLPPAQGAKVGDLCFFGTGIMPGRLRVGGSFANSTLYCGSFFSTPAIDSIVFYGGAAALAFAFLPGNWKWYVSIPLAALGVLGATMSVSI